MTAEKIAIPYTLAIETLVGQSPANVMLHHGPSKLLIDDYHWHSPNVGIVASYSPTEEDVKDHFNMFRGVDQIESFAQTSVGSCSLFLQVRKQQVLPEELKKTLVPLFTNIGNVVFHGFLEKEDTLINVGQIKSYKFRQMVCEGRTYKAPKGLDLDEYFRDFTDEKLLNYDLAADFILITEYFDIIGRGIKIDKLKN